MPGLTLDAGALIAFERNDRTAVALVARSLMHGYALAVPAGVVAQVWRNGRRQARLARLLGARDVEIAVLDDQRAREAGQLCGVTGTHDIVDASVILCARARRHRIVTSDPDDLRRLDSDAVLIPG
ncbi:MAG TPA: PIN domain-containing protein [Vicinamibacterales bacterium]